MGINTITECCSCHRTMRCGENEYPVCEHCVDRKAAELVDRFHAKPGRLQRLWWAVLRPVKRSFGFCPFDGCWGDARNHVGMCHDCWNQLKPTTDELNRVMAGTMSKEHFAALHKEAYELEERLNQIDDVLNAAPWTLGEGGEGGEVVPWAPPGVVVGARVKINILREGICSPGQAGVITEHPCDGEVQYALVEFDTPIGDQTYYPFHVSEFTVLPVQKEGSEIK